MKRILTLLTLLALIFVFASCDYLPESVKGTVDSILEKIPFIGGSEDKPDVPDDQPHEHDFVLEKTKDPTCSLKGKNTYKCACGEEKVEEFGEPLGHDPKPASITKPTCTNDGGTKYKCSRCGFATTEKTPATGHNMGVFVEASRLIPCLNENCSYAVIPEGDNKYKEVIVYKFSEDDIARFNSIYGELEAIINAAAAYDKTLHAYEEGSDTEAAYLVMEAKYEELYDIVEYVTTQYQIAQIEYHVSMNNATKKENYDYISEVRTDLIADFYSFSQPIYDSMFREYYYYGMTEAEIKAFIFDSNAVANPEYKALTDRNTEIELEFLEIVDSDTNPLVLDLYYEFVMNNKRIAQIMGYDNYLEYAYENMYDRDYSYEDVKVIFDNVKRYISPAFTKIDSAVSAMIGEDDFYKQTYADYLTYMGESFFSNYNANKMLNDYIDLMAFTSNPDKQITFSDELNKLMSEGNLFRGDYEGAYVTSLYSLDLPVAYFGSGYYSNSFTVAHEFGHFMNEIYSGGDYSQSFDLLEMHSQGNELLYLSYMKSLEGVMPEKSEKFIELYQLYSMLSTVMNALAVDAFEQAVYTNTYTGSGAKAIMEDGTITKDEYDTLYASIIKDLGGTGVMGTEYWRYVTILSPCYYVSYSVSALSVLQLYPMANEDFDEARDSYLKLFTYVDGYESEDDYITTEQTLLDAGLYSFTDPALYRSISNYFSLMLAEE